jgi:hypothetical protein
MKDFVNSLAKAIQGKHTAESLRRSKICGGCDEKKKAFYPDWLDAEIVEVQGFVCNRCECPIASKVFATSKKNICPKWLK